MFKRPRVAEISLVDNRYPVLSWWINCTYITKHFSNRAMETVVLSWSSREFSCKIGPQHFQSSTTTQLWSISLKMNIDWTQNVLAKMIIFLEHTNFATQKEGYSKNEIARAEDGNFLTVNVSLAIVSFLEVDEIGQTLKVILEIKRTWFDPRLTLLHLQQDSDLNVLWEKNYQKLWYPKLLFENIDPSKAFADRFLSYKILRNVKIAPMVRFGGSTNGTNVFKGSQHKMVRTQEYTYYWRCVYNLKWYPFDIQTCDMKMNLPKHYRDFIRLNPEKIEYKGDRDELTEYHVDKLIFCSKSNGTHLVLEVTLNRPLISSVLTIYIPTLLLLVIRFHSCCTEYKKWLWTYTFLMHSLVAQVFADEFPDLVVQVHLTVLLVLASL